jgi:GR25 family glycosyltransferase involved in LPS biosynthesis
MKTYYINLDAAPDRRDALESNFRQFAPPDWRLVRAAAVGADEVRERNLQGRIRPSEIACLLSHRKAVAASLTDDDHAYVVEDDALFGPSTFPELSRLTVLNDQNVDLVFTSALLPDLGALNQLFLLRRSLLDRRQVCLFDLSKVAFAAADAYIVKKEAKSKLLGLLDTVEAYDVPYDLLLRAWIHQKRLTAVLVFPCITSLSPLADSSNNGNAHPTWFAWNCLRRLLALDAQHYPGDPMNFLDRVDPNHYDQETDRYAQAMRVLLARNLVIG